MTYTGWCFSEALRLYPSVPMFIAMNVLQGVAQALSGVATGPFLMENSGAKERTYLFSLSSGLRMTATSIGEWLGGSGGGWQDSGGVWPGIKTIEGELAQVGDVEHGVSRGRLLPRHRVLGEAEASAATRQALQDSLILVHGGMSQNVGPILEMVTALAEAGPER